MDFKELLNVAVNNKETAQTEASVKRYSSVLPPPKKIPKSGVQSENIRRFLEKKKAEEAAKAAEAQKRKEQLLAIRAQSSKNNKRAKIMASRTKDNDFSKIRLTEDEIEAKKKREELLKRQLTDKVERMKARIELEEKEKLLPRKRKRKSKQAETTDVEEDPNLVTHFQNVVKDLKSHDIKTSDKNNLDKSNKVKKFQQRPPPPSMSFSELLKVAAKKQYEPVEIRVQKKEEEKLMTKKEKKLMEEEQRRLRRKQERMKETISCVKSSNGIQSSLKKSSEKCDEKGNLKKPVIIQVEKHSSRPMKELPKLPIPKKSSDVNKNIQNLKVMPDKVKILNPANKVDVCVKNNPNFHEKGEKNYLKTQKRLPGTLKEDNSFLKEDGKKILLQKKNGVKSTPISAAPVKESVPVPSIDEDAIAAAIEKRIREKLEKEMEARFAAKFGLNLQDTNEKSGHGKSVLNDKSCKEFKQPSVSNKAHSIVNGKNIQKPENRTLVPKGNPGMILNAKREVPQKPPPIKPQKRPFHTNPYLDPPRRLLEPQRPPKLPPKRRIESDDEEEEDDMSDFIDDGPSQNDEDYSKYIKEIFGYDRNRYVDDDDDDVVESSFVEQMKEEVRSAKLGYLEDLEEERKLQEIERRRKKKLKK